MAFNLSHQNIHLILKFIKIRTQIVINLISKASNSHSTKINFNNALRFMLDQEDFDDI